MAGVEIATAYVSIVPSTEKLATELTGPKVAGIGDKAGAKMGTAAGSSFVRKMAGALSVSAIAAFGKASIEAFAESEASAALLKTAVDNTGVSYETYAERLDEVINKQSYLAAFDDEDMADAMRTLTITTGNTDQAMGLLALTTDFARAKNMDLTTSAELIGKVAAGNLGILSRYGIVLEDGATATEALAAIQEKVAGAGQAYGETTAGSLDRIDIAIENFQEAVGANLAPAAATVVDWAAQMLDKFGDLDEQSQVTALIGIGGIAIALGTMGFAGAVGAAGLFAGYLAGDFLIDVLGARESLTKLGEKVGTLAYKWAEAERAAVSYLDATAGIGGGFTGGTPGTGTGSGGGANAAGSINPGVPQYTLWGEDGAEAIIPLTSKYRSNALALMPTVLSALGYDPASGGGNVYHFAFSNTSAADIPRIKGAVLQVLSAASRPGMAY